MATPSEELPSGLKQSSYDETVNDPAMPYVGHLASYLDGQGIVIEEIRDGDHLEAIIVLDGFARAHAQKLAVHAATLQPSMNGQQPRMLPHQLTKLNAKNYVAEVKAAPAHRPQLVHDLATFAVRNGRIFPQIVVATALYGEIRASGDRLKPRTSDLLTVYGKTIKNLPGFGRR